MKYLVSILLFISATNVIAYDYFGMKKVVLKSYEDKKVDKAYKTTMSYITKHPKDMKAQNLLATLYFWQQRYDESESLLNSIIQKEKYLESIKLLKLVKKKNRVKKEATKIVYKEVKNINKDNDILGYLEKDSNDLQSKMILAKYYFKIEKFKKAYIIAKEALDIDSDQKDMKKIISHTIKKDSIKVVMEKEKNSEKAKEMLHSYFQEKNYLSYFNLFQTLKSSDTKFTEDEYSNALYSSVMIGQFKEAKKLIAQHLVPLNKKILQVQLLLDKKLASK
jgi:tetratricopeptide (TPR) repeat protein